MSQVRPPAPAFEEPKPGVSIERMVFLERVERIMASEARIKEIEAENKTLVGMVARLNKELEELKAKLAARS
jgi:predicted RNase H-like nuclease (RuvC/YqgF family)